MEIYQVGGAVRDALLGLPVHDHDWVVVGGSPERMLAEGFRAVGRSFPVFLHPKTHEEYALARIERKTGQGHTGFECYFSPDVTLEEDLSRRDLTINAMAQDKHGALIDPYGGQQDLRAGLLRHVSPAFEEDPLRVLRIARFAARFNFQVAEETRTLLVRMVADGLLQQLSAERIWAEWEKGFASPYPVRMLEVLRDCGALKVVWPALDALFGLSGQWPGEEVSSNIPDLGIKLLEMVSVLQQNHGERGGQESNSNEQGCYSAIALYSTFLRSASKTRAKSNTVDDAKMLKQHAQWAKWPGALIDFQQHVYATLVVLDIPLLFRTPEHWVKLFEQLDGLRRPQQSGSVMDTLMKVLTPLVKVAPELTSWLISLTQMKVLFHDLQQVTVHDWIDTTPPAMIPKRLFTERIQVVERRLKD